MAIKQNQNNFFIPAVPPLTTTSQRLPGGWYYLAADSTVPFVTLIGSSGSQKTFTWGELVNVPDGQMVTVRNESFMKGDIQINSGRDYASKPARISTVVDMLDPVNFFGFTIRAAKYPADTRLCRRAYVAMALRTKTSSAAVKITGKNQKHSMPFSFAGLAYTIPAATYGAIVPLGYNAFINPLLPMALTDQVTFELQTLTAEEPGILVDSKFFYILEY